jgi:hypothetical protein
VLLINVNTDKGGMMSLNNFLPPDISKPVVAKVMLPKTQKIQVPVDTSMADTMYDRLVKQIVQFQNELDEKEEVGAYLTHFGKDIVISIADLRYHNPGLIIFDGYNEQGDKVTLLQHMSQVNVLLCGLKVKEERKPRRIGFATHDDEGDSNETEDE